MQIPADRVPREGDPGRVTGAGEQVIHAIESFVHATF
jgi:hypothetical protein